MRIEMCSFSSSAEYLFAGMAPHLPIEQVKTPSGKADMTIVAIDAPESIAFLKQTNLSNEKFVVFFVVTMSEDLIPFLKCADYIVWSNQLQSDLISGILELNYRGETVPMPIVPIATPTVRNDMFLYCAQSFTDENDQWFRDCVMAKNWFWCPENGTIRVLFTVPEEQKGAFARFVQARYAEPNADPRVEIIDIETLSNDAIVSMIATSMVGEYFVHEKTEQQVRDLIENKDCEAFYLPLRSNWILEQMAYCGLTSASESVGVSRQQLVDGHQQITFEQFSHKLLLLAQQSQEIVAAQRAFAGTTEIDTAETLNFVHGSPLSNRYIFSICFRNQYDKIIRAIDSILIQRGNFDYGIAIVDDCSTDGSSELILNHLREKEIDFVLVTNEKRRFTARNFYNVIHFLTVDDESILIELDGDDYLAGDYVLEVLDREYSKGALKTSGRLVTLPEDSDMGQSFMDQQNRMDFSHPWNISACNSWLMLRSCKLKLLRQLSIEYFLERRTKDWLKCRHDSITQSRVIELAGAENCVVVPEILYIYDISGDDHIHGGSDIHDKNATQIKMYKNLDTLYRPFSMR